MDGFSRANIFLNQRNMPNCTRLQTLLFELRMLSPDGAVEHRRVNMVLCQQSLGATLLAAATVARTLMLNPVASQSHVE